MRRADRYQCSRLEQMYDEVDKRDSRDLAELAGVDDKGS